MTSGSSISQLVGTRTVSPAAPPADNSPPSQPAHSRCLPWLAALIYPICRHLVLPLYFSRIEVFGQEHLPKQGALILAPTHRSRWDAFMVPYAAGHDLPGGRALRFMVTTDEVKGIQGWFIRRLGGFPIDTRRPSVASLRHSVELLESEQALVIFPEGNIYRQSHALKSGLARLALQAQATYSGDRGVQVVPMSVEYSHKLVPWRCSVKIRMAAPLSVASYVSDLPKHSAKRLTADLATALDTLSDRSAQEFICPRIYESDFLDRI